MEKQYECAICNGKPALMMSVYSYHPVCNKHISFDKSFQIEVVQRQLNIIEEYSDEFKKCEVCKVELTPDEYNTIEDIDMTRTCKEHRAVRKWVQLDLSIEWFELKKESPEISETSEADWAKFIEWKIKKDNK